MKIDLQYNHCDSFLLSEIDHNPLLTTRLRDIDISIRALKALEGNKINTIGELKELTLRRVKRMRNVGAITLKEINDLLVSLSLNPLK